MGKMLLDVVSLFVFRGPNQQMIGMKIFLPKNCQPFGAGIDPKDTKHMRVQE